MSEIATFDFRRYITRRARASERFVARSLVMGNAAADSTITEYRPTSAAV